ncbi:hypothetical protein PCASD_11990 [Puccinia coronata f. sp. avenae]|uniref:Uncharacterized protein n=1 Tax=Puccinia coronata f. sp. avenae TaxID=200324 RepID=A0A2N5UA78_9BASI|nr:hypothetical protein PCASD_11990 [Puccinia coronata f. sp. avenae]
MIRKEVQVPRTDPLAATQTYNASGQHLLRQTGNTYDPEGHYYNKEDLENSVLASAWSESDNNEEDSEWDDQSILDINANPAYFQFQRFYHQLNFPNPETADSCSTNNDDQSILDINNNPDDFRSQSPYHPLDETNLLDKCSVNMNDRSCHDSSNPFQYPPTPFQLTFFNDDSYSIVRARINNSPQEIQQEDAPRYHTPSNLPHDLPKENTNQIAVNPELPGENYCDSYGYVNVQELVDPNYNTDYINKPEDDHIEVGGIYEDENEDGFDNGYDDVFDGGYDDGYDDGGNDDYQEEDFYGYNEDPY